MPKAGDLRGDLRNYTDIAPVIQFNEVLIAEQPLAPRTALTASETRVHDAANRGALRP